MADSEVHTLTGAYVCDALGEDERAAFEEHMARCPECEAEVRELREVTAIMAAAVSRRPPASLKAAVDARIGVTRQVPPATADPAAAVGRATTVPGTRVRRLRTAWTVAAALALLAAGLGWRAVEQQHRISALNAQATQISQLLAAPDAYTARVPVADGGSALLVGSRTRGEAAVSFTGLPGAPAGKTYQLWLIAPDGTARSAGLMQAAPDRPILITGLTGDDRVGMTIEPAAGSTEPTTTPVMVAALGT